MFKRNPTIPLLSKPLRLSLPHTCSEIILFRHTCIILVGNSYFEIKYFTYNTCDWMKHIADQAGQLYKIPKLYLGNTHGTWTKHPLFQEQIVCCTGGISNTLLYRRLRFWQLSRARGQTFGERIDIENWGGFVLPPGLPGAHFNINA